MVPAPGLFSMMMPAPRSFAISCASTRAMASVPPPGAKGTMILMTRSGYPAKAGVPESNMVAASTNSTARRFPLCRACMVQSHQMSGSTLDHPRHNWNSPQQPCDRPAQRQRGEKDNGKLDSGRPGIVVNGVLQPKDEDVVREKDAIGRWPHRIEQLHVR